MSQVIGLTLSLILAIGLVGIPTALAADPDYTKLDSATAEQTGGKMKLSVTAGGDIPRFPDDYIKSVPVFGYAWLENGKGVVAAIHPSFDDSAQNPRAWHTHPATLNGDNCITDLGKSQGGISIKGDTLTLQISGKQADNFNPDTAASFEVHPDNSCPDPHLRVDVKDHVSIS